MPPFKKGNKMKKQFLEYDEKKGKIKLITQVNLDPLLIKNKQDKLNKTRGYSPKRSLRKIASIPLDVLIALGEKGIELLSDDRKMRRWLKKHPEYMTVEKL